MQELLDNADASEVEVSPGGAGEVMALEPDPVSEASPGEVGRAAAPGPDTVSEASTGEGDEAVAPPTDPESEASAAEAGKPVQPRPVREAAARPTTLARPTRRKPPVVNRRGPSEIDWALRMSQTGKSRPASTPRKIAEGTVSRGTVIRLDRGKGFGFLVDASGEHRFFHRSSVLDNGFADLQEQQAVDFEAHTDERGARALKVRPAGTTMLPPKGGPKAEPSPKFPPKASPKASRNTTWHSDLSPFRNGSSAPTRGPMDRGRGSR